MLKCKVEYALLISEVVPICDDCDTSNRTKPSLNSSAAEYPHHDDFLPHWGRLIPGQCILLCILFLFLLLLRLGFEAQRRAQQNSRIYP